MEILISNKGHWERVLPDPSWPWARSCGGHRGRILEFLKVYYWNPWYLNLEHTDGQGLQQHGSLLDIKY